MSLKIHKIYIATCETKTHWDFNLLELSQLYGKILQRILYQTVNDHGEIILLQIIFENSNVNSLQEPS